jgi:predicted Zn-dependent protease
MVFGDSPKQGVVRNNEIYHAELGFTMRFPAGWRVRNGRQNVLATSPGEGDAFIDLRSGGRAQGSPEAILRKRLNLGSNATVTPTEVNGLAAAVVNTSISGNPTRVMCVFLGDSAYLIGAQTRSSAGLNQYQGEIESSVMSFREIADQERAFAHPFRLRVITAQAGLTFAELARRAPLGPFAEGYLRVINGMYPAGEPTAGQPLKIVE